VFLYINNSKGAKQMKNLSIKGLKTWASREGGGYQFNLYEDGKKVLFVHNDGNGGCLDLEPLDGGEFLKRLNAHCKTLPPRSLDYLGLKNETLPVDIEIFLEELLSDYEQAKQIAKAKKKGVVFTLNGNAKEFYTLTISDTAQAIAYLDKKYPNQYALL
jgi:hypothetical protein